MIPIIDGKMTNIDIAIIRLSKRQPLCVGKVTFVLDHMLIVVKDLFLMVD